MRIVHYSLDYSPYVNATKVKPQFIYLPFVKFPQRVMSFTFLHM